MSAKHLDFVKYVLEQASDLLNKPDKQGYTPLHLAAMLGAESIIEVLVENKADKQAKTNKGQTPLELAISKEQSTAVKLLTQEEETAKKQAQLEGETLSFFKNLVLSQWKIYPKDRLVGKYMGHQVRYLNMSSMVNINAIAKDFLNSLKEKGFDAELRKAGDKPSIIVDLTTSNLNKATNSTKKVASHTPIKKSTKSATANVSKFFPPTTERFNSNPMFMTFSEKLSAAQKGDAEAQYHLGAAYKHGIDIEKNIKEAVRWYHCAAEQGHILAQHSLAVCYDEGVGITKDLKEAVKWYLRAAEQGYKFSQHNLALCYSNGQGVEKNAEEAAKWSYHAAKQGIPSSQFNLGFYYSNGQGVKKDVKEAAKWYRLAAEQGHTMAIIALRGLESQPSEIYRMKQ